MIVGKDKMFWFLEREDPSLDGIVERTFLIARILNRAGQMELFKFRSGLVRNLGS